MSLITTDEVPAVKILKMFGLKDPGKCRQATITFKVNDIVVIESEQFADVEDMSVLEQEVQKYKLVPIGEPLHKDSRQLELSFGS